LNVLDRSFGNVSVVINALAVFSQLVNDDESEEETAEEEMEERIFEMGRFWPMTPVDMTSVSSCPPSAVFAVESFESRASVALTIPHASSSPCLPVTAFAQPELTTTPLTLPPVFLNTSSLTRTGAAWKAFLVKHAAAEVLPRGVVDSTTARSSFEASFLTPAWTPVRT
jgi:hypothetical protein